MSTAPDFSSEESVALLAGKMLDEARADLRLADQKAGLLLTALGVGIGALLAALLSQGWHPSDLTGMSEFSWWLGALAGGVSTFFAGWTVLPRTAHSVPDGPITYWGHVAKLSSIAELEQRLTQESLSDARRSVDQLFHVSVIAADKFARLRRGVLAAGASISLYIVSGLLSL